MNNKEIIAELKEKIQIVVFSGEEYNEDMVLDESESLAVSLEDVKLVLDKASASSRQEFICRNCADVWNTNTSDEFEAGRQSAQKEIDELKHQLAQKDKEKQEQVQKLRDKLKLIETDAHPYVIDDFLAEIFPDMPKR